MSKHSLIKIMLAVGLLSGTCHAQNFAVVLWSTQPTNAQERIDGIPDNWPVSTLTHPIGTNTQVSGGALLMTKEQFLTLLATNQAAFNVYQSNLAAKAEAAVDADKQALKATYQRIPDGIAIAQGYSDAWSSGTNFTAEQLQEWAKKNNEITLGILRLLDKLGPELLELYKAQ